MWMVIEAKVLRKDSHSYIALMAEGLVPQARGKAARVKPEARSRLVHLFPMQGCCYNAQQFARLIATAMEARSRPEADSHDGVQRRRVPLMGNGYIANADEVAWLLAIFFVVRTFVDVMRHATDGCTLKAVLDAAKSSREAKALFQPILGRVPGNRSHDRGVMRVYDLLHLQADGVALAAEEVRRRVLAIASVAHFFDPAWVHLWIVVVRTELHERVFATEVVVNCLNVIQAAIERAKPKLAWHRSIMAGSYSMPAITKLFSQLSQWPADDISRRMDSAARLSIFLGNQLACAREEAAREAASKETAKEVTTAEGAVLASRGDTSGSNGAPLAAAHAEVQDALNEEVNSGLAEVGAVGKGEKKLNKTKAVFTAGGITRILSGFGLVGHQWKPKTEGSDGGPTRATAGKAASRQGAVVVADECESRRDANLAAAESAGRATHTDYGASQGSGGFLASLGINAAKATNAVDDTIDAYLPKALDACRKECPLWLNSQTRDAEGGDSVDAIVEKLILPMDADGNRLRHTSDVLEGIKCELERGLADEAGCRNRMHRGGNYANIIAAAQAAHAAVAGCATSVSSLERAQAAAAAIAKWASDATHSRPESASEVARLELSTRWPTTFMTQSGRRMHVVVDTSEAARNLRQAASIHLGHTSACINGTVPCTRLRYSLRSEPASVDPVHIPEIGHIPRRHDARPDIRAHGYVVLKEGIPCDEALAQAIRNANYHEGGLPTGEPGVPTARDILRQQTADAGGRLQWNKQLRPQLQLLCQSQSLLDAPSGTSTVCKVHGLRSFPTPDYVEDCHQWQEGDQWPHLDYPEEVLSRLEPDDVPLAGLYAFEGDTRLRIRAFSGEWITVVLQPGDVLVFSGWLCHYGLGYARKNHRVHFYIHPPAYDKVKVASSINPCPLDRANELLSRMVV